MAAKRTGTHLLPLVSVPALSPRRIIARAGLGLPATSGTNVHVLRQATKFTVFPRLEVGDFSSERSMLQGDTQEVASRIDVTIVSSGTGCRQDARHPAMCGETPNAIIGCGNHSIHVRRDMGGTLLAIAAEWGVRSTDRTLEVLQNACGMTRTRQRLAWPNRQIGDCHERWSMPSRLKMAIQRSTVFVVGRS